jgi:hypothetical protein
MSPAEHRGPDLNEIQHGKANYDHFSQEAGHECDLKGML